MVPDDNALASLSLDYAGMLDDGLLVEGERFETLIEECRALETRANRRS